MLGPDCPVGHGPMEVLFGRNANEFYCHDCKVRYDRDLEAQSAGHYKPLEDPPAEAQLPAEHIDKHTVRIPHRPRTPEERQRLGFPPKGQRTNT